MEQIFITGHRNPDLDSICSAYAYARLKNELDPENQYIAVNMGIENLYNLSTKSQKIISILLK